jgi:hypothetical protein
MAKRLPRSKPTWTDVKAKLAGLDRINLLVLVQDLYAAHKDNQTFLHTRFGLGEDVLKPYKETLARWLSPNVIRNQEPSVAKAKQAISSENAAGFSNDFGYQDASHFNALIYMLEQALKTIDQLPEGDRDDLIARLDEVCTVSHNFGYGVGDDMDVLLEKYVPS